MNNKGQKIIDKFVKRDFNNELEEVLTTKNFDENVKNLLLDILYKLENSYGDYKKVKIDALSEEEYIENLIKVIKQKCDSIKLIKPKIGEVEQKNEIIIDEKKKEIICYPMINKLLYAISKIQKKDNIVKDEDNLLKLTLSDLINIGNNINNVEPLRDFNGFSWNIITSDIENLYYNLIYQDLIILVGNKFFDEWANKNNTSKNYMELLKNKVKENNGQKSSKSLIDLLKMLSVLIEINRDTTAVKQIYDEKQSIEEELEKLKNSEQYLGEISERKKSLLKKIKRIDITLNNKELLKKEYDRRNSLLKEKNKIFSVKVLSTNLKEERKQIMQKIKKCNNLMNPKKIIQKQNKLNNKLKYRKLVDIHDLDDEILKNIIELQKIVFKCMNDKIKKCTDKNELIKIMCQIRYINLMPVNGKICIKDIMELKQDINKIKKSFYMKANELNLINNISENNKLNMSVLEHIFGSKIISLDQVSIKIVKSKSEYFIQFYDEGVRDETFKIDKEIKSEDIKIKLNKEVRLFNTK